MSRYVLSMDLHQTLSTQPAETMIKPRLLFLLSFSILFACQQGVKETVAEKEALLTNWPEGKSPEAIGEKVAKRFVETSPRMFKEDPNSSYPRFQIFYQEVCAWLGALWFSEKINNKALAKELENIFQPLFGDKKHLLPSTTHGDHNVFGSLPLELYLQTKDERYKSLGLNYADTQWTLPDSASASQKEFHDRGYSWQTRLWIDDMYVMTILQLQAYRATKNIDYVERSARAMVLYMDSIQLDNGLFYHEPSVPFIWGRGNGWIAVGLPELLRWLPKDNPNYEAIMGSYKKMMASLLKYQTDDGMWLQLIDDKESWPETSCTAMFAYAMTLGVQNGWLDKEVYGAAVRKAWIALTGYLTEKGDLREVCQGTNIKNDRMHYMNRKRLTGDYHGQAALLWLAAGLAKN